MAFRTGVGCYDMSSFGKIRVEGPGAEKFLNYVCGGDMSVAPGSIVYTQVSRNSNSTFRQTSFGVHFSYGRFVLIVSVPQFPSGHRS